jgi:hypothetical protein
MAYYEEVVSIYLLINEMALHAWLSQEARSRLKKADKLSRGHRVLGLGKGSEDAGPAGP